MRKTYLIPLAAVALIGAGAYGVTQASAASTNGSNPRESLVQKIADTFHLDKSKVQAVFDQDRADHQAQRETDYEQRLTQAVTDGKLTADQKTKILAEHKALQAKVDAAMQKTGADRRTAMDAVRTEGEQWAKDNGVDARWLMGGGPGMGKSRGHSMMRGDRDDNGDSTPANAS